MIFKTFNSDIDKTSAKWGIFGRSFNDYIEASNKRKIVIDDMFAINGVPLKDAKKQAGSFLSYLYPKKEDIKSQLIDVDSLIPKIEENQASKILETIKSIENGTNEEIKSFQALYDTGNKTNQWIAEYAQSTKNQIRSTEGVIKANQQARTSASAHNEKLKQLAIGAKASKVALDALKMAGNMIAMWAISKGIELAVKGMDNLVHSAEHCKERVDQLMSNYQSALDKANANAQTIEELADKYEKLSKGVNNLGENVSLTTDEYAEYNKIASQIADMFPTMVQGYTNKGNAILSLKGNVEELRDAYKDAQQEAYNMLITSGKDSNGNDIIKNYQNMLSNADSFIKTDSSAKEYVEIIQSLQEAMLASDEEYKKLYSLMTTAGNDNKLVRDYDMSRAQFNKAFKMLQDIGFKYDLTDEDRRNINNTANAYIQTYQAEIDNALKNVRTLANAYLMTNEDYAKLDEQSKNAASIMVNSINENIAGGFEDKTDVGDYVISIIDTLKNNPDIRDALVGLFTEDLSELSPEQTKDIVDRYIKKIADALGEDELELKIRLGFDDVDTIARNYDTVMRNAAGKFTGTAADIAKDIFRGKTIFSPDRYMDFEEELEALETFAEENSINTQDEIAFWNKCVEESETREKAMEKYLSSSFISDEDTSPSLSSTIDQLNTRLKPTFDSLKSAYQNIFTNDGFTPGNVDISTLDSIRARLEDLNTIEGISIDYSSFDNLARILADTSAEAEDVREAFNLFATDIVDGLSPALSDCSGENYKLIQSLLESAGIMNAEEVMVSSLGYAYEDYAAAKKECADAGIDLVSKSEQEIEDLVTERLEADNCGQALALLQLKKALCNETALNPGSDINSLYRLAKAAGIATENIAMLAGLNDAYEREAAAGNTPAALAIMHKMEQVKADVEKQFAGLGNVQVEFDVMDDNNSSSKAAQEAETDWKNLLDKEITLLEKQLDAGVITFKGYIDRRRGLIEDYYRDGKTAAEDYYASLESMYDNQLSLYDRAINAVTDSIDDEIDRLKDRKEAIEESYQVKIDAIQEEIDALTKANDARKAQIDLEKAQYEAKRARNQRVNKVFDGGQFIYEADMESVRDAEDDLADKEFRLDISRLETQIESLKAEMENAAKSLDVQIDALEAYKNKWNEISGVYEEQQDKLIAAEILGADWEAQVLNGRLDTLKSFTDQYIALQQAQADAAVNAARIKAEADAGNTSGGNVGSTPDTQNLKGNGSNNPKGNPDNPAQDTGKWYIVNAVTGKQLSEGFDTSQEASKHLFSYANTQSNHSVTLKKYHTGLGEGYVTAPGRTKPVNKTLELLKKMAAEGRISDEVPAILQHGELVITPKQQQNILNNAQRYLPLPIFDSSCLPTRSGGDNPQVYVDNITISCPNITNNSGADYILKSLQRLPLDTIQYTHRRK